MEGSFFVDTQASDQWRAEIQAKFDEVTKGSTTIRGKIRKVYERVWTDFYEWEQQACGNVIRSLATDFLEPSPPLSAEPFDQYTSEAATDRDEDDRDPALSFLVEDFDHFGDLIGTTTIVCTEIPIKSFVPHPKYEACTPAAQIIQADNYTRPSRILPFIQYAGETNTGNLEREQVLLFRSTAWQDRWRDPDHDLIALDTVLWLIYFGISCEDIDRQRILPSTGVFMKDHKGLLWRVRQRDLWVWNHSSPVPRDDYQKGIPSILDLRDRGLFDCLNECIDVFCPNMNCLSAMCLTHFLEPADPLSKRDPRITNDKMREEILEPCANNCFLAMDHSWILDHVESSEKTLIFDLLNVMPDEIPCVLSQITRSPCYRIYLYRLELLQDKNILSKQELIPTSIPSLFEDSKEYTENAHLKFGPVDFCTHSGPCRLANCDCFRYQIHCRRNCRCSFECKLRFRGCRCKNKSECQNDNCPCYIAQRECDPERCGLKSSRRNNNSFRHKCSRTALQLHERQPIEIRVGSHGLGAFAIKNIAQDALIGEYISQCHNSLDEHIGKLYKHIGLNYIFALNEYQTLDAAHVGNETRYINHATGDVANIYARVVWVNGEHRIGFYAARNIKKGKELFFDYGEIYWTESGPSAPKEGLVDDGEA